MAGLGQVVAIKCDICEDKVGTLFCYECSHYLCQPCELFHRKIPSTKHHHVTDSYKVDKLVAKNTFSCVEHKREYALFCTSCGVLICALCVTTNHSDHNYKALSDAVSEARINLKENVVHLKEKVGSVNRLIENVKTTQLKQVKDERELFTTEVRQTSNALNEIIESIARIFITKITDHYQLEHSRLSDVLVSLEGVSCEYASLCDKYERALTVEHDISVILSQLALKKELGSIDTVPNIEEPNIIEKFSKKQFISSVLEKVLESYNMSISADGKMLSLFGPDYEKLGVAKHKTEIDLGIKQQSQGRRNRVFNTDSDTFSASSKKNDKELDRPTDFSKSMSNFTRRSNMQTYKTKEGITVKVYAGDILALNVDCIVNAANETLSHGGGVARAIAKAAGYAFELECDDLVRQYGPLKVGSCCNTSAGKLHYRHVIHTVGPIWNHYNDKSDCCRDLKKAVVNCFFEAELLGMTSIALPPISTGIFGVPKDVCCGQYYKAVEEFSQENVYQTCLKEIHFIDTDDSLISLIQNEFCRKLNRISTSPGSAPQMNTSGNRLSRSISDPKDADVTKNNLGTSTLPFQNQFMASNDVKVNVVQNDITKMTVNAIVCPQDESCLSRGAIAKAIENVSHKPYKKAVRSLSRISKGDIRTVKASPQSLPFQYVLQTVPPRFDQYAMAHPQPFEKDLERTIRNILCHSSDKTDVTSIAMPVLGIGTDGNQLAVSKFSKTFVAVLVSELKSQLNLKEINIVTNDMAAASTVSDEFAKEPSLNPRSSFSRSGQRNDKTSPPVGEDGTKTDIGKSIRGPMSKDGDNCVICLEYPTKPRQLTCGHIFCSDCIEGQFKVKPVCPTCGSIQGVVKGDQPDGIMRKKLATYSLPSYPECKTIEIEYEIYSGTQGKEHPEPGKYFKGIKRTAFLPYNRSGQLIASLLRIAFERKLVFTIGHSRTTGQQGVVTWNDIHHKTSSQHGHQFGYPDDTYFDRVLGELKIKGVTEEDLK